MKTTNYLDKTSNIGWIIILTILGLFILFMGFKDGQINHYFFIILGLILLFLSASFVGKLIAMKENADKISSVLGKEIKISAKGYALIKGEFIIVVSDLKLKSMLLKESSLKVVSEDMEINEVPVKEEDVILENIKKGEEYISTFGAKPEEFE
jgi:hypothetical protein